MFTPFIQVTDIFKDHSDLLKKKNLRSYREMGKGHK